MLARPGRGALVMLVGEPGIGKTALCERLANFAAASGGQSLVGHCYEEARSDRRTCNLLRLLEPTCSNAILTLSLRTSAPVQRTVHTLGATLGMSSGCRERLQSHRQDSAGLARLHDL